MKFKITTLFLVVGFLAFAQETIPPKGFSRYSAAKGNLLLSTTFSVNHKQSEKQQQLTVFAENSYRVVWDITFRGGYFVKDNLCLGGYFSFGQDKNQLSYYDGSFLVRDEAFENIYGIAPFMRNYLPLGDGRFMLYNQTSLEFKFGKGIQQINNLEDIERFTSQSYKLTLGLQPGIAAFINELVAVEIGTRILGVSSEYTKTEKNNDPNQEGYVWKNDVSFEIDLLSLFLGITFYFPV